MKNWFDKWLFNINHQTRIKIKTVVKPDGETYVKYTPEGRSLIFGWGEIHSYNENDRPVMYSEKYAKYIIDLWLKKCSNEWFTKETIEYIKYP